MNQSQIGKKPTLEEEGNEMRFRNSIVFKLVVGSALTLAAFWNAQAAEFKEAPSLAALSKQGSLPPVEKRLPENPLVVKPYSSVGKYGGTLRTALRGGNDTPWLQRTIAYDSLVTWDAAYKSPQPDIAESFEVSEDARTYTFKLRKGLRWSDGHPFTADDVLFWSELYNDPNVTPAKDQGIAPGGKAPIVTKLDDLTVRFSYEQPNGLLLVNLCLPQGFGPTSFAKHVVSKYYKRYNPEADTLAKTLGFDNSTSLLRFLMNTTDAGIKKSGPVFPTMNAWRLTDAYRAESKLLTAERNPFYFKVDSEGNQLPYIDKVTFETGSDVESLVLRVLQGQIDVLSRHVNTNDNVSVLTDGQSKGKYQFYKLTSTNANTFAMSLNQTNKDESKRKLFTDKNFRIGLSEAINRQEIIDTVFFGLGTPMQVAVPETSPFYNKQLATQYTAYDLAQAGAALDKAGLSARDGEGYRQMPDGKKLTVSVATINTAKEWIAVLELVRGYWQKVGIRTDLQIMDRSLLQSRIDANDYDGIVLWPEGGSGAELKIVPRWFLPLLIHSGFGPGWFFNVLGDPRGADWPLPENVKVGIDAFREMQRTASIEAQDALVRKYIQQAADNFYAIGISSPIDGYGIVGNRVKNMPLEGMWDSYAWPQPAPFMHQLWLSN